MIQYGGSIILARLLTPKEMGVYAIALGTIGILGTFVSLGLTNFVIRERELTPEKFGTAFCVNALIGAFLATATLLLAGPIGHYMREDGVTQVMRFLALAPLIGVLDFPSTAIMQREMRFKPLAIIQVLRAALTATVTIVSAMNGQSYLSLAWGTLSGNLLGLVCVTALARPASRLKLSFAAWHEVSHFGSRMMLIGGVIGLAVRMPEFILGRLIGLAAVGIYSRASSMLSMVWDNVYSSMTHVLVPSLAEVNRTQPTLRPVYLKALAVITGLFWPAFGGVALLAGPLIHWMYGTQWTAAAPVLTLLCIGQMIQVAMTMTWEMFVIKGELNRQARFEIFRAAFLVLAFYLGAKVSMNAAAASRIAEALFTVALYGPHMRRMTGASYRDFALAYWGSLKLLLAALLPPALLMQAAGWRHDISLGYLFACVGAGAASWLVAAFITSHPAADEVRKALRSASGYLPLRAR